MTASNPDFPTLKELLLPAKDLLHGLRRTLARSRRLAPVRDALPDPLRHLARDVAGEIEGLAAAARDAVERGRGAAPRRFTLAGIARGPDPALHFAEVAGHGLDFTLRRMGRADLMVSETVAALAYRAAGGADASAAGLVLSLTQHHAAGAAPGTSLRMGADETRLVQLAGFAVLLWMTVPRESAPGDEADLLALCADLTASLAGEVAAAGTDEARLGALLAAYGQVV